MAYHKKECEVFQRLDSKIPPVKLRAVVRLLLMPRVTFNVLYNRYWETLVGCDGRVDEFRATKGSNDGRFNEMVKWAKCAMEYSSTSEKYGTVLNIFCAVRSLSSLL